MATGFRMAGERVKDPLHSGNSAYREEAPPDIELTAQDPQHAPVDTAASDFFKSKMATLYNDDSSSSNKSWSNSSSSSSSNTVGGGNASVSGEAGGAQTWADNSSALKRQPEPTSSVQSKPFVAPSMDYAKGKSADYFGHQDYANNKLAGWSDQEMKDYLDANPQLLREQNVPGGGGLYDQLTNSLSRKQSNTSVQSAPQPSAPKPSAPKVDYSSAKPGDGQAWVNKWSGDFRNDTSGLETADKYINYSKGLQSWDNKALANTIYQRPLYNQAKSDVYQSQWGGDMWKMDTPSWTMPEKLDPVKEPDLSGDKYLDMIKKID